MAISSQPVLPTWTAATTGQQGNASSVNQFLGTHNSVFAYGAGTLQDHQTTGTAVYTYTVNQYISQQFTMGSSQTTIGQVLLQLNDVGGSPTLPLISPLSIGIYADDGLGNPTGSALGGITLSNEYIYSQPFWVTVPLVVQGLTASQVYHLVTSPVGTLSPDHYYTWQQSNRTFGALLSTDGSTWTSQSYGMLYQIYDNTGTSIYPTTITEDLGARWTSFTYDTAGRVTGITEFTQGQTPTTYIQSTRTISYASPNTAMAIGVS